MKKTIAVLLTLTLLCALLSGCKKEPQLQARPESQEPTAAEPADADFAKTDAENFTERDQQTDYDASSAVSIRLDETTASASSESVKIDGSKITITEEATYELYGTLKDGMLIIDAPETAKLQLIFNGVNITSETSAALYVLNADKVFLTLAEGTENTLANGGSFTAIDENNIDGALFSKQDLTLNGAGALTVTSPAGHGIVCKDDLVFTGGNYIINSASHGLDANDSVRVANANLTIDAGKDAIHAENTDDADLGYIYISSGTIRGEAEGDGIAASANLQIEGGTIDLLVGGGSANGSKASSDHFGGFMGGGHGGMRPTAPQENTATTEESSTSMKGLKAAGGLLIAGGNITIDSADDAVHSDASAIINGGTFTLASGDDALHAEETLTVTAGNIAISECYEGLEALHIDLQGGDIRHKATDDGLNAAGGTDQSGTTGGRDGMFGGGPGGGRPDGPVGMGGGMSTNSNGSIQISGGTLYINASGDGIDANGTLEIRGGHTVVVGPTQGDTATLDYDKSATIAGGTFIGTGASGMAQTFSESEQGVVAVSAGNQAAGTTILLKNASGKTILVHTPELNFAVVILSSPELQKGATYTIAIGSQTAEIEAT